SAERDAIAGDVSRAVLPHAGIEYDRGFDFMHHIADRPLQGAATIRCRHLSGLKRALKLLDDIFLQERQVAGVAARLAFWAALAFAAGLAGWPAFSARSRYSRQRTHFANGSLA